MQIVCFEKFFNKFNETQEIKDLVEEYIEGKQEIRKDINRIIYLEELANFKKAQGKPPEIEALKQGVHSKLDKINGRFHSFQKTGHYDTPKPSTSGASRPQREEHLDISSSSKLMNKDHMSKMRLMKDVPQLDLRQGSGAMHTPGMDLKKLKKSERDEAGREGGDKDKRTMTKSQSSKGGGILRKSNSRYRISRGEV